MLNQLESRRLLAATAAFQDGTLEVMGTKNADVIDVLIAPLGSVTVSADGAQIYSTSVNNDVVTTINILSGGRDDDITVSNNEPDIAAINVFGHSGNDTIRSTSVRGVGASIFGGNDNDRITVHSAIENDGGVIDGMRGDDRIDVTNSLSARGARVLGGEGRDRITLHSVSSATIGHSVRGGPDQDTITGGDMRDVIFGDEGNDVIRGGGGDDVIFGGTGSDRLFGDDGDDFFDGGSGRDTIDGGDDEDWVVRESGDVLTSIEDVV